MTMDTTMESGRESNSIPKNQTTPKRSFDVAFLTGVSESHRYHNNNQVSSDEDDQEEDLRCAAKKSIEDKPTIHSKLQQQQQTSVVSGSPKSAFKKVSKINHNNNNNTAETSASSSSAGGMGNNLPVDLSMMMSAAAAAASSAPPYYHPFSFPAIATTLSLQLLQQNNAAKGLAMSLFSHPAAAAAAAAMAAHQQSFFQQQQQQHPPMKSGGGGGGNNLLHPSRATDRRPDGANNLIEDYLRAQASLYQHQSEKDFNLFPANNKTMRHADSSAATYCPPPFHSAMDHRLSRPNSSSMAPPPPPPPPPPPAAPTPTTPQSQQQSVSSSPIHQIPAAALAASLASAPSQNVCAKCNLSFRMTSDLVYHMRSQHRRDANTDPVRQKRQEKLRCPVCGENFRERHHLTRHMTSHEDRELETK
ncbi:homeotic protein spalt-major-like isoform X2 [Daphnia pulex]|uniref:homeotic protein spalt-major-like isoform X2 n=1 Tax=Daphnia pulex TaxID=6669 RepID=UPI001EE10E45|nr:homeotic protein spalt-major-like isoform X2 [Daphnia pulex]XP_046444613.1 homeotic protein spalt-major-like isoform X2 [Daphnia pulex]XP_046444614.1 homeotic protein spalt-major-like isoform X2 [Daphnia pulex]